MTTELIVSASMVVVGLLLLAYMVWGRFRRSLNRKVHQTFDDCYRGVEFDGIWWPSILTVVAGPHILGLLLDWTRWLIYFSVELRNLLASTFLFLLIALGATLVYRINHNKVVKQRAEALEELKQTEM